MKDWHALKNRIQKCPIQPSTLLLGLYFILLPLDFINVGGSTSLLKWFALLPVALALMFRQCRRLYLTQACRMLILFTGLAAVSIVWTIDFSHTTVALKSLMLNSFMTLFLGACCTYNATEIRFLKVSLVLSSWLMAILLLIYGKIVDGRLILNIGYNAQDANTANGFLLFAIAYHMKLLDSRKNILHAPALIILISLVFATGSRGAVVAVLGVMTLSILLNENRSLSRRLILLGTVFILGLLAIQMFPLPLNARFSATYIKAYGSTGRMSIWQHLIDQFLNANPFRQVLGHGYGSTVALTNLSEIESVQGKVAHNIYLDMLLNLGILGLSIYLCMHIVFAGILYRHRERALLCTYAGFLLLCLSLSLYSFKPFWAVMTYALIIDLHGRFNDISTA